MTIAGMNCRATIWRYNWMADDAVGGAVPSGTIAYINVQMRFQERPHQQILLQQGLEVVRTFSATIIPGTLDIRERDEVEITAPQDHVYFGDRFRVVGVIWSDFNRRDPRNYMMLNMVRSERAHVNQ